MCVEATGAVMSDVGVCGQCLEATGVVMSDVGVCGGYRCCDE